MSGRLHWVDAARGGSVVAVVIFHVCLWFYLSDVVSAPAPVGSAVWGPVNSVLGGVRMPVLLVVSGLLATRLLREGLSRATLRRVARPAYLYVLWLCAYALFFALVTAPYLPHRVDGFGELAVQLVVPRTVLWYVLALAVYQLVLAALRRVPPFAVFVALVALSVWAHSLDVPGELWPKIPELFVFYAIGVYGAGAFRSAAERARWWNLVPLLAICAAAVWAAGHGTGVLFEGITYLVRGTTFAALAVVGTALVCRWRPVRVPAAALGRRTVGIYVLHPLWIAALTVLVHEYGGTWYADLVGRPAVAVALPLAVTAAVVAASLGAEALATRVGARWLFAMPGELHVHPLLSRRRGLPRS